MPTSVGMVMTHRLEHVLVWSSRQLRMSAAWHGPEARSRPRLLVRRAAGRGAPSRSPPAEELGLRLGVDGRGLRVGLLHAAGLVRRRDHARLRLGTAVCQISARTPAADGHDRPHARPPLRRPVRSSASAPRARRWSRAGTASRTRSRWPAPGSTSRSSAGSWPARSRSTSRASTTRCRCRGEGTTGLGKPLKSITHPLRADLPDLPRRRGAEERGHGGRDRRRLAADLPVAQARRALPRVPGRGLRPARRPPDARTTSRSPNMVQIVIDDDVEEAADLVRMSLGFYIGGMGAREVNFHANLFARMGYEDEVERDPGPVPGRPQGRGHRPVPARAGRGRRPRRPDRQGPRGARAPWRKVAMTTLLVSGAPDHLRQIADLVRG